MFKTVKVLYVYKVFNRLLVIKIAEHDSIGLIFGTLRFVLDGTEDSNATASDGEARYLGQRVVKNDPTIVHGFELKRRNLRPTVLTSRICDVLVRNRRINVRIFK